jgi:hypothetical protein
VITFNKRMSHGLQFLANYTLSKATDGGQVPGQFGTFNGTDSPIDPRNRKLEYALSDLDQRQRFVSNVVWMPQYAKKLTNKPARVILDGFVLSSIVLIGTGQPLTPTINGSAAGGPAGGLTGGTVNNSGTALSSSRFPGLPRNAFTGPGLANVDFRLGREFKIRENMKLSFVGEAFNLFNFTNIYQVNATLYNYTTANTGACLNHTNNCVVLNPAFNSPTASNSNLSGARQLQISGRFTF